MKNKAHNLATYAFSNGESLLFDTNVWLYLFPAPSNTIYPPAKIYSAAFKRILSTGAHLVLDAFILSEYLNRYCRIEWSALYQTQYNEFKRFRQSPDFVSVGQSAAFYARKILTLCTCHDHPFMAANVTELLKDFESGGQDLNDRLLTETCRHHGWKLVTHDSDFVQGGIDVLTGNQRLMAACV